MDGKLLLNGSVLKASCFLTPVTDPGRGPHETSRCSVNDLIQPLPDLLARNLSVVFCGINPGMRAARSGHHFDGRGNRFWQVLHLAALTPFQICAENDRELLSHGYGLTTVVERPTARASELTQTEFGDARARFEERIRRCEPRWLAFLGKSAVAGLLGWRDIPWGEQSITLAGAKVWVLPNPSGLNRSFRLDDLIRAYAEFRQRIA